MAVGVHAWGAGALPWFACAHVRTCMHTHTHTHMRRHVCTLACMTVHTCSHAHIDGAPPACAPLQAVMQGAKVKKAKKKKVITWCVVGSVPRGWGHMRSAQQER